MKIGITRAAFAALMAAGLAGAGLLSAGRGAPPASSAPITGIGTITIHVHDQAAALAFYTHVLGFEKRQDFPMGKSARWLTVAPAGEDTEIFLESADATGNGVPLGLRTGIVLYSRDVDAAYARLSSLGVKFTQEPAKQPWGGEQAQFVDPDGNGFVLLQAPAR